MQWSTVGAAMQFHGTLTNSVSYSGTIAASANLSGTGVRFLAINVNGTDVFTGSSGTGSVSLPGSYATTNTVSVSTLYPLSAGDVVQIMVVTNSIAAVPSTTGTTRLLITKM